MSLDPRLNAFRADLADKRLQGQVEADQFTEGREMVVAIGTLPLLEGPEDGARRATELLHGELVTVFSIEGSAAWLQAESDSYVGYAPTGGLALAEAVASRRVSALATFLYEQPDLKSRVIDTLPLNAMLAVTGNTEGDFIELATGGWVFKDHAAALKELEKDFVTVAERFLHAPYLWGGKTAAGVDCSGLVQMALRAAGHTVLRDTDMQAASIGEAVEIDSPRQRGDIVFFPGHVGIMLDEETLLHANAWTMTVARHPLSYVTDKIAEKHDTPITAVRRI